MTRPSRIEVERDEARRERDEARRERDQARTLRLHCHRAWEGERNKRWDLEKENRRLRAESVPTSRHTGYENPQSVELADEQNDL